jgi:hypothetical protein
MASVDGVLFGKNTTTGVIEKLIQYPIRKSGKAYTSMPITVKTIGDSSFGNNTIIEELTIPASVSSIEQYFLIGCVNIDIVNYNAKNATNVSNIHTNISQINIGSTVEHIPSVFLGANANINDITIPSGVRTIGTGALSGALAVKNVYLNANLDNATTAIFSGTNTIENVYFGKDVYKIPNDAFKGCSKIGEVDSVNVNAIGTDAFQNCTLLNDLVIKEGFSSIASGAFTGCTGLGKVTFYTTAVNIAGAFDAGASGNTGSVSTGGNGVFDNLSAALTDGGNGVYRKPVSGTPDGWRKTVD